MPRGQWKQKYLKQYKIFQKNVSKAISRGYLVPFEIFSIPLARGGYKQAYERIHKLDLRTIQRKSSMFVPDEDSILGYSEVKGNRAMSMVRKLRSQGYTQQEAYSSISNKVEDIRNEIHSRYRSNHYGTVDDYDDDSSYYYEPPEPVAPLSRSEQLEKDIADWQKSDFHQELEQLYKDTYESVTGEKPTHIPYIPMDADASTIMNMLDSTIGDEGTKPYEAVDQDAIYRANDLINQFQNRELKYRAHKALQNARTEDPTKLAEKLSSQSSDGISILQEGAQITYSGESVENDDRASMWLDDWIDFLSDE